MQRGYTNNINFKITFSGIMLGLVIVFQYLEQFMPMFNLFMNINLSLIFIMATIFVAGYRWGIVLLLLRFIIGPAISPLGYSPIGMWSHFILLSVGAIFMTIFIFLKKVLSKLISNEKISLVLVSLISIISTSIIVSLLNGSLFTPMYWHLMNGINFSINESYLVYEKIKGIAFFNIPNYWVGMFVAFGVGNLVKFTIISIGFISIWKIMSILKMYK